MTAPRFDHLVVCAADLEAGRAWAEARLGLPPGGSGRHAAMGTHNALWGLGSGYLEVIAIDPEATPPPRPRWFGLDDPALARRIADGPALVTWAAAVDDLQAAARAAPVRLGPPMALSRDDLTWEVAMTEAAVWPLGGAWPLLIHWQTGLHPAERLGDQGLSLMQFEIAGSGAGAASEALAGVAATAPVVFAPDDGPTRLSAVIATPAGEVML